MNTFNKFKIVFCIIDVCYLTSQHSNISFIYRCHCPNTQWLFYAIFWRILVWCEVSLLMRHTIAIYETYEVSVTNKYSQLYFRFIDADVIGDSHIPSWWHHKNKDLCLGLWFLTPSFNNISEYPEKTNDMSQVTDKL